VMHRAASRYKLQPSTNAHPSKHALYCSVKSPSLTISSTRAINTKPDLSP
jgi:hypothetical protein